LKVARPERRLIMSNMFKEMEKVRGEGPWMWTDALVLAVDCDVNEEVAASWLPGGLRLSRPGRATIVVADYRETSFGPAYHEAGVLLHVKLGFSEAVHCPWMLVDDDVALILGREYMCFPKKLGQISLSIEGDRVRATVGRKGTRLIDIDGTVGSEAADAPPLFGRLFVNVWSLLGLDRAEAHALQTRGGGRVGPRCRDRCRSPGKHARPNSRVGARTGARSMPLPNELW
jgi:acetoacetate decarboxylase